MSDEPKDISRRKFLKQGLTGLGAVAIGAAGLGGAKLIQHYFSTPEVPASTGKIVGANSNWGHLIRKGLQTKPTQEVEIGTLIVGGGVAGLAAGWELLKQGNTDFRIVELDRQVGGNAVSGEYENNKYPWGAHYLPLPNLNNKDLLGFLEEVGCITGYQNDLPVYDELYLCHSPQERLLYHGVWQDGLVPRSRNKEDIAQINRFFHLIEIYRETHNEAGEYLFDIPLDRSWFFPEQYQLDSMTFAEWLKEEGFTSEPLLWYLNYCCRDDFGSLPEDTSAWAGLHYFAGRRGKAANAEQNAVLAWPQGNGWLVDRLRERLADHIDTSRLILSLHNTPDGIQALQYDPASEVSTRIRAHKAICCTPQFVTQHLIREPRISASRFTYAPWLVANIHLRKRPQGPGRPLSWDNVAYGRPSLGYVVSDHQRLTQENGPVVLTWYEALAEGTPEDVRKKALDTEYEGWKNRVEEDLEFMHPGIKSDIEHIDVWIWGHGMVTPRPGFITGKARKEATLPVGNIHFAHSDLSGISIFEEAFSQGLRAAREAMDEGGIG